MPWEPIKSWEGSILQALWQISFFEVPNLKMEKLTVLLLIRMYKMYQFWPFTSSACGNHPSLRMWRMSLTNQRNERPHLSNGLPESKPVDCSSHCRNLNCSLQLQRDCCSLQSGCCRQATISPVAVYSAGAPGLPNNVSLAGVCSRVHTSEEAPEAERGQPWHWRLFWQSDWEQRCRGRAISRHR